MLNVQGYQAPAKRQEMLKKSDNLSMKMVTEQSKGRHCWDQFAQKES
jgi:hypothetical protein